MSGQIEREYQEALDGLRFSGEAKERMVENLTAGQEKRPVKGKRFHALRAGVIAACLCVALAGTAFAALNGIKELRLSQLFHCGWQYLRGLCLRYR